MWQVSADWLASLGRSHGRYTRMEVWYGGDRVAEYRPQSGSVQVTARNRIRRTLTAVLPESAYPSSSSDPLAPYGARLKVYQGITGPNGGMIGSEVPVFAGRIASVKRQRFSGQTEVTADDPFADVNDLQFEASFVPAPGSLIVPTIEALIIGARPETQFLDYTGAVDPVPAGMMWDQDRGQAVDDLAAAIGAEVFFLPDDTTCIIRPIPTLGGTPVWTLTEGQGGVLLRDTDSRDRADVANRIVVHGEAPGQVPLQATVTDDGAASLTRYGGPYGRVVRHYSNALITSTTQAITAGTARLARSIGATRVRQLDTPPNPALEAGDLIAVATANGAEQHIADSFGLPFEVSAGMTTQTRSTGTSIS